QSRAKLEELLREISTGDAALQELLAKQAQESGIELLLEEGAPAAGGDDFDATPDAEQTRVRYADPWACGEHREHLRGSTGAEDVARVMGGEKAALCLTDPPYGIGEDYESYEDTPEALGELIAGFFPLARENSECMLLTPGNVNLRAYPAQDWVLCWFGPAG